MWETIGRVAVSLIRFFSDSAATSDGQPTDDKLVSDTDNSADGRTLQDYELVHWGAVPGPWY
jgi:hypothetical protein